MPSKRAPVDRYRDIGTAEDIVRCYDSWSDLIDAADIPKRGKTVYPSRTTGDHYSEWSGTPTYDDASRLARHGWTEPVLAAGVIARRVQERVTGERDDLGFQVKRDVVGVDLDIDRFALDDPECFIEPRLMPAS